MSGNQLQVEYHWWQKDWNSFTVLASPNAMDIAEGSEEERKEGRKKEEAREKEGKEGPEERAVSPLGRLLIAGVQQGTWGSAFGRPPKSTPHPERVVSTARG